MDLSADQKTMQCTLDTVLPEHKLHLTKGRNGNMRYLTRNKADLAVLSEVHFYIPKDNTATLGPYTLTLDNVQKIEVIERDKGRTTGSYVIGAVGVAVGAGLLAGIIILATKSFCPFVSAYNGDGVELQGEIYGGAIYPQMARHDYLPLKMTPLADGTLRVKISNELQEKQYTDFADLLVITHDKDTKVMVNEKGEFYSIASPKPPVSVSLNNKDFSDVKGTSAEIKLSGGFMF